MVVDLYQHYRIKKTDRRIRDIEAARQSREHASRWQLQELEHRIERLEVVNQTLWLLLSERIGLTEAEFGAAMARVIGELEANEAAGGPAGDLSLGNCSSCDAKLTAKSQVCQFCGAPR